MAIIQEVIADGLGALFNFIGQAVQWSLGLLGVILVTTLSLSGEVIDDLTTYKDSEIDYYHLAKVMLPPIGFAIVGYVKHKQAVDVALHSEPPK